MVKKKRVIPIIAVWMLVLTASGCDRLSVKDTLEGHDFRLTNQFNEEVRFPDKYEGKIMLVGFVYTHCPDICPVITYNMMDIQEAINDEERFMLVSVSFDPQRDTPEVLSEYASNYRLNQNNWQLLTGDVQIIESLLEKLEIGTLKSPTRFSDSGTPIYFIDHTDKITLIDKKGQIRRNYPGSELDKSEVIQDIQSLLNE
ncbi:MAG: SCO family protein [Balneolaceae bacterium]